MERDPLQTATSAFLSDKLLCDRAAFSSATACGLCCDEWRWWQRHSSAIHPTIHIPITTAAGNNIDDNNSNSMPKVAFAFGRRRAHRRILNGPSINRSNRLWSTSIQAESPGRPVVDPVLVECYIVQQVVLFGQNQIVLPPISESDKVKMWTLKLVKQKRTNGCQPYKCCDTLVDINYQLSS